jgi:hypothetical protein
MHRPIRRGQARDTRQMRTVTPRAPMHKHTVGARTLDYNQDGQAATTRNPRDNTRRPALIAAGAARLLLPPCQE